MAIRCPAAVWHRASQEHLGPKAILDQTTAADRDGAAPALFRRLWRRSPKLPIYPATEYDRYKFHDSCDSDFRVCATWSKPFAHNAVEIDKNVEVKFGAEIETALPCSNPWLRCSAGMRCSSQPSSTGFGDNVSLAPRYETWTAIVPMVRRSSAIYAYFTCPCRASLSPQSNHLHCFFC